MHLLLIELRFLYENHDDKKFQMNDTAHYFFEEVDRLSENDYCPTIDDILRVRVRTTGVQEASFKFSEVTFRVIDVGGQRSERRKWIHCFDSVTAVIFCASLSDYDQSLRENKIVNRFDETIALFDDIYNYFTNAAILLFLNKTDLFREKIKRVSLKTKFDDYHGGDDYETALKFVESKFLKCVKSDRKVWMYPTCAVNTDNIKIVIEAVKCQILTTYTELFIM